MAPETTTANTNGDHGHRRLDTQNVISFFLSLLDRIASPATRQRAYNAVFSFCYRRPAVSSFLAVQLFFAAVPVLCALGFSVCCVLFIAGVTFGAVVFCVGVAAVLLFWTLVFTATIATASWVSMACCLVCVRWIARVTGFIETPPRQETSSNANTKSNTTSYPSTTYATKNSKAEQPKRTVDDRVFASPVCNMNLDD
ncbi:hypothetical protein Dda_0093 [Drechslerella dactyloides]|uniref:Uncharacterized protein n=1 Tax=Drechslerella dactyloides TaxID=74499 RepID=A0AAD6J7K1_DREDA|nr:hypothetical protein Dda_0093 [Drechslerella dactyloides]